MFVIIEYWSKIVRVWQQFLLELMSIQCSRAHYECVITKKRDEERDTTRTTVVNGA